MTTPETTPYFAYGSNMNLAQMAKRCPAAIPGQAVVLDGFAFAFNGDGHATIVEAPGGVVHGGLWELTDACVTSLDDYEGIGSGTYRHGHVRVERPDGTVVDALTYVAADSDGGAPTDRYVTTVLDGAADFALPADYRAHLHEICAR